MLLLSEESDALGYLSFCLCASLCLCVPAFVCVFLSVSLYVCVCFCLPVGISVCVCLIYDIFLFGFFDQLRLLHVVSVCSVLSLRSNDCRFEPGELGGHSVLSLEGYWCTFVMRTSVQPLTHFKCN